MQVSEQTFQQADFELLRRILPYIEARIILSSRTPARARKVPRLGFENCLTTSGVGKCGRLANVAGWLSNCKANKLPVDRALPLHQMYQKTDVQSRRHYKPVFTHYQCRQTSCTVIAKTGLHSQHTLGTPSETIRMSNQCIQYWLNFFGEYYNRS
jgi:hypothetical protein